MRRHPSVTVFTICFVAFASILLLKNRQLFSDHISEEGDLAANSILIQDAKHFDLLVGNYSRQDFNHPGPAAFYVQAGGEALFHDILGVTPSPYGGQAVSILLLNSALGALVLMIVYDLSKQRIAVILALAAFIAFCRAHPFVLTSTWTPYYYFAPFVLLLVSAASVAAGKTRHLWCLALAGGLLVHGHVQFLLFVPVISMCALVGLLVHYRDRGWRHAFVDHRRHWFVAGAVVAIFLLPIVLDVVLHYPGEFGRYWAYSRSNRAGGHTLRAATHYVLHFWPRGPNGGYALPLVLVGLAALLAVTHPVVQVRRLLVATLGMVAVATALFIFDAVRGLDTLNDDYLGFFYWAAPLSVIIVAVVGAAAHLRHRPAASRIIAALSIAVVLVSTRGNGLINTYKGSPNQPAAVSALAASRVDSNQPLVIKMEHAAWPDAVGVVVEANRLGIRACIDDPTFAIVVTHRFMCNADEAARGEHIWFQTTKPPSGPLLTQLPLSLIVRGDGPAPG
jgi:hypothetical protein